MSGTAIPDRHPHPVPKGRAGRAVAVGLLGWLPSIAIAVVIGLVFSTPVS